MATVSRFFTRGRATTKALQWRVILILVIILFLGWQVLSPITISRAAASLTIAPITWNVVGLDASNPNLGPNIFPVGVRVCNTGDATASNVVTSFLWDSAEALINLFGPNTHSVPTLAAQACTDFYYNVVITRDASSLLSPSREYHITASADGVGTISTPVPREIWVEPLTSQPNIHAGSIHGPTTVFTGQTYQFIVQGGTTPDYEQLEHFVNFPNSIFHIKTVTSTYSSPPGATNNKVYADACGWDGNPTSTTYLSCIGPANYPGGKIGGSLVTTYTVDIVATGTVTLTNTIYGYLSGTNAVYEYQAGSDTDNLTVSAQNSITSTVTTTPTPTYTLTPTGTVTHTATSTLTPTVTGTPPTQTLTPTVTGTPPTATRTSAPTVTGTPPTPTVTGTLTPVMAITKSVSPSEARVNANLTFTMQVKNTGNGPATNVTVTDSFSSYLDITSETTTQGTKTRSGRTVTVSIGTINPNQTVNITIVTRVNSTATSTVTLTNSALMAYTKAGINQSISSNSVSFRVIGSSTLPGTGGLELEDQDGNNGSGLYWPAIVSAVLLGLIGIAAVSYSFWAKKHRPGWSSWYRGTGLMLIAVACVFGLAAWGLQVYTVGRASRSIAQLPPGEAPSASPGLPFIDQSLEDTWLPYLTATPETLPDYPIPTPSVVPTEGLEALDTSAVNRIVIPALDVDTVVKYVPYDGWTWLIGGLKQEVAWLGNTSWPGLGSNTALAGHVTLRDGGNGPFRYLGDLAEGDIVILYTDENIYTYQVREQRVVEETDLSVVQPSNESELTLITCTDWDSNIKLYLKRLIVSANLVEVKAFFEGSRSN